MEMIFLEVFIILFIWVSPAVLIYLVCRFLNNGVDENEFLYMADSDRSLFNAISIVPIVNIILAILLSFVFAMAFFSCERKDN